MASVWSGFVKPILSLVVVFILLYIHSSSPLVLTTGCNARAVPVTSDRWEDTVNRFWQQISDLNTKADGVVQNLKTSQLTRELE